MTPMDEVQPNPVPEPVAKPKRPTSNWFVRLAAIVFVIFCFEVGLFLLIYPWTDAWTDNTLSLLGPGPYQLPVRQLWNNPYFRGLVSGVGILNLWIAITELFSLFRGPAETKADV